jgi:hypothetical protein
LKRFLHELHGPCSRQSALTHLSAAGLLKLLVGKLGTAARGKERLFEQILGSARQAEGGLLLIRQAHLIARGPHRYPPAGEFCPRRCAAESRARRPGPAPADRGSLLHADLLNRIAVRFHLAAHQATRLPPHRLHSAGGPVGEALDPAQSA